MQTGQVIGAVASAAFALMLTGCATTISKDYNIPPPDWFATKIAPEPDAKSMYFVGQSGYMNTEDLANTKATENGRAEVAATIETRVNRVYQFATEFVQNKQIKKRTDVELAVPEQQNRLTLVTEAREAARSARQKSICIETRIEETRRLGGLFGRDFVVHYKAVALIEVPLARMAHAAAILEARDRLFVAAAEPLVAADLLGQKGFLPEAVEVLKRAHVSQPDDLAVLDRLGVVEQEAGLTESAIQHTLLLAKHPAATAEQKARAEARLQSLSAKRSMATTDNLIDAIKK